MTQTHDCQASTDYEPDALPTLGCSIGTGLTQGRQTAKNNILLGIKKGHIYNIL